VTDARSTTAAALHPLVAQLFAKHRFAEVDAAGFDAFAGRAGHTLLLFTEDPLRIRETLDLAVIVPEIARAFAGRFAVGVLLPAAARQLHARYGFRRWPALVMLRDGRYAGAIDGLRNWDEYVQEIARLLDAPATRPPVIGIAVAVAAERREVSGEEPR
jgi:hydrogenase-1 operon protein HyaE